MVKKSKATVRKRIKVDLTARRAANTKGGEIKKPEPRKLHDLLISGW
jgi:hypothetical protein